MLVSEDFDNEKYLRMLEEEDSHEVGYFRILEAEAVVEEFSAREFQEDERFLSEES